MGRKYRKKRIFLRNPYKESIIAIIILYFLTFFKWFFEKTFNFYNFFSLEVLVTAERVDKGSEKGYNKEEKARRRTMRRIYLDHAATTPLDKAVLEKMTPYLTEIFGNADSPHETGRRAMRAVDNARDSLAEELNAKPSEIFFTSGGTESDNWALRGGMYAMKEKGRTHFLISSIEHHAVLHAAKKLEEEGFTYDVLPVNGDGVVEISALRAALTEKTGMVAVMLVNNETGALQPVRELAELARENGSLFFCDGVQAAPYLSLDVAALGVDMLSFSAHKFYGPKGCGALYVKKGIKIKELIVGGEQERGLRGGTTNVPAVVGLSEAYKRNQGTMYEVNEKIKRLRTRFLEEIFSLRGVSVNGEGIPAILNLRIAGVKNVDLVYGMDLKGISIAAGAACASGSIEPSHVLLAMGLSREEAGECLRISFGKENTEEEIVVAATALKEAVNRLRGENF